MNDDDKDKIPDDDSKVVEFAQLGLLLLMVGVLLTLVFPPVGIILLLVGLFTFLIALWNG